MISHDVFFYEHQAWDWTPEIRNASVPVLDHVPIEEDFDNSNERPVSTRSTPS